MVIAVIAPLSAINCRLKEVEDFVRPTMCESTVTQIAQLLPHEYHECWLMSPVNVPQSERAPKLSQILKDCLQMLEVLSFLSYFCLRGRYKLTPAAKSRKL